MTKMSLHPGEMACLASLFLLFCSTGAWASPGTCQTEGVVRKSPGTGQSLGDACRGGNVGPRPPVVANRGGVIPQFMSMITGHSSLIDIALFNQKLADRLVSHSVPRSHHLLGQQPPLS